MAKKAPMQKRNSYENETPVNRASFQTQDNSIVANVPSAEQRNPVSHQSPSPNALLTRAQTGAALRAHCYPVADKSLATMATRGGGPPFRKFGRTPLYRWGDALEWAEARLSPLVATTSELSVVADKGSATIVPRIAARLATNANK